MDLRKVISIKNVGRFLDSGAAGDVTFRRYNLIFAENGRGKTTLCAILRSLSTGDPAFIMGRKTLGVTGQPEVRLLTDSGTVGFSGGSWDATRPEVAVSTVFSSRRTSMPARLWTRNSGATSTT